MQGAHKLIITIPEDRRVELQLPDEMPVGPAEVIVLVPPKSSPTKALRPLGMDEGLVTIADDFDAPLPNDLQRSFEGET